ncbi:MAG: hypothetical protein JJU35_02160 [Balneolales bacterium]|nr:hypothetical protein [Balneolales bacterium]
MEQSYWQARWRKNKIGFNGAQPDAALLQHWPALSVPAEACVAVPLCGKSVDMRWLREQGHRVYGVEFVEQACGAFFEEHHRPPDGGTVQKGVSGRIPYYEHDGVLLQAADFLKLRPKQVPVHATALYDRAALVALPAEQRPAYAARWTELFPKLEQALLISFEYDQALMGGPPFSVGGAEIRALFGQAFSAEELSRTDMVPVSEKYRRIGLPEMIKVAWRLSRR